MKFVDQSYEILTPISEGGITELKLIERAARVTYKTERFIDEEGESAKKLVANLIKRDHLAMLEHSFLSVLFITDRGIANEIVRHRHCAFAQESTRWCNYTKDRFDNEITFLKPSFKPENIYVGELEFDVQKFLLGNIESIYKMCINQGATAQEARDYLPLTTKTELVVSTNYREWRHIFKLRTAKDAHPKIQELMGSLLADVKERIPIIFDDLGV